MGVCSVHECKNYDIIGPTISYHKFPKEPSLRNKWIYACKRPKHFNVEAGHVCSLHFTVDDYERDLQAELTGQKRRKRLKQFVVPHLLLPTDDCKAGEGKDERRKDETANKINIHDPVKENSIQTVWVLQGQLLEEDKMKNNVNQSKNKKYLSPSFTIEKTCRTCLCDDKMIALSKCVSNSKTTLKEVLLKFGNMMVSNKDYLPENICLPCAKRTEDMYHFQEQCKRAEQKLREFFKCPLQRADETLTPTPYLAYELLELDIKPEVESISVADNSEDLLDDIKDEDMPVLNGETQKQKCRSLTVLKKHLKAPTHKPDPLSVMDKKKFECNICKKLFSTKSGLARHCGLLHKTPYTCKMCERCLPNKKLYNMHIKQYHRKADELSRGHRCDTCGKLYKILLNLQIHQRTCQTDEISFDCPHCDLKFAKLRLLATHIRMTHPTEKPYVCYVCKKGFVAVSNVYVHLRSHVRDKQYNCTMCDKLFFNENNLEIHMKRNHSGESHKCTQCSKSFTHPRKLTIHMRTHIAYNDMRFKCKFCPKRFNQSHHLQNHERVHTGQRPFLCTVCGKGFAQSYGLTVHMRYHSGVRPHVCQHCGKSFTQPQSLNMHVLTHTGEKQHMCSCCGKRFSVISSLRKHMSVHAEGDEETEKRTRTKNKDENSKKTYRIRDIPYSYDQNTTCKVCQTTFASNTSLQAHMRKHIYQFVCKICKRGYSLSSSLEAHLRTHSGGTRQYFCSEPDCNAVFNRPDHLKYHFRRSHSKEKPYVCLECDKGFYQSGDLKVHMRRHTGEKPYGCKFCQKRFVAGSALTVHERTHTGERPYACSLCAHKCLSSSALASHMNSHTSKEVQNITSSTSEDKSQM